MRMHCIGPGTPDKALRYQLDGPVPKAARCGDEFHGQIITRIDRIANTIDFMWLSHWRDFFGRADRARRPVL